MPGQSQLAPSLCGPVQAAGNGTPNQRIEKIKERKRATNSVWTTEIESWLAENFRKGLSCREIAKESLAGCGVQLTHNQVAGRIGDLRALGVDLTRTFSTPEAERRANMTASASAGHKRKSLLQVDKATGCRFIAANEWPYGKPPWCGKPTLAESAWCEHHHSVVYVKGSSAERGRKTAMTQIHDMKCDTAPFYKMAYGEKSAEIRLNDRGYRVGDILMLRCFDDGKATGPILFRRVIGITEGERYGLQPGYVMMSVSADFSAPVWCAL